MENKTETLLVGFTNDILIVGKKRPNETMEVINAFQGEEAEELYRRLTEKKDAKVSE